MTFPSDFVWGAASAAYQVEGGAYEDGKGLSVWDVFCKRPGVIHSGDNGDITTDHYHRSHEDVSLMRTMGLGGYRFSVSWPRVLPDGIGRVNGAGLDFYDRLVDDLLANNIQPFVTLFHWDYPYELYCKGGWLNRDSAQWFADYATTVVQRLGDRVTQWMTMNEPEAFVGLGHFDGWHAPGLKLWYDQILRITHHVFLAHGLGVQAIRAATPQPCQVGLVISTTPTIPATESAVDIEAARQEMFSIHNRDLYSTAYWYELPYAGRHADDFQREFGEFLHKIPSEDMAIIHQPLDFMGMNCYQGKYVRHGTTPEVLPAPTGKPLTTTEWKITPEALYWGVCFLHERYKLPIYVTENGVSLTDWVSEDGAVHDPQRIDFLTRYLRGLRRATDEGLPVRGYFQWSLTDNFEWAGAYKHRFGLIYVDYPTQKRILKDSAYWYQQFIARNGSTGR